MVQLGWGLEGYRVRRGEGCVCLCVFCQNRENKCGGRYLEEMIKCRVFTVESLGIPNNRLNSRNFKCYWILQSV